MKTKLYLVSDGPWAGTGFGEELRNIAYRLAQSGEYEIIWQSLQHLGYPVDIPDTVFPDIPHKGVKVKIVGTVGLPNEFGSYIFPKHYDTYVPDLVMFMGDPKNIRTWIPIKQKVKFPLIMYVTLDGLPIHPRWLESLQYVNLLIAMSGWAQMEYMKVGLSLAYIHHGINWNYWSTNDEEKKRLRRKYKIKDDTVLYISRDTNQHRKRQDVLLKCWRDFHPESKNVKLLLWTDWNCRLGWMLEDKIKQFKVPRDTILSPADLTGYPKFFDCANSLELEREIAQLGDVYLSASSGEGFGKNNLEAISLNQPVIATNCSAITEVVGKGGILVPTYNGGAGRCSVHDGARSVEGFAIDQEKFIEAMLYLYQNPKERIELGHLGREHAREFDYDTKIIPAWLKVLAQINPDEILVRETLQL